MVRTESAAGAGLRDDTVRPYTRILAAAVIPFLLVAFPVVYIWPGSTGGWFAWEIKPTMTAMLLGAAYLGGAYFFARVVTASQWHTVKSGFPAVGLFASLLGVATVLHWTKFTHNHVAFVLWAGLYFTTPFLIVAAVLANRTRERLRSPDDLLLSHASRWIIGATGLLAAGAGVAVFAAPGWADTVWPWAVTPLTGRVVGAVFCLGLAGLAVFVDSRWTTARLMVETAVVMVSLILVGAARAHAELRTGRPLTWMLLAGLAAVLVGAVFLHLTMSRHVSVAAATKPVPGEAEPAT